MTRASTHFWVSSRRVWPAGIPRALAALALALPVATCRDALGPRVPARARIAVAPILPSEAALADFGLTIDAVRFIVVRPAADTLADTTLALPPDSTELSLDLRVAIVSVPETLRVSVVALSGTLPLFAGTRSVPVPSALATPIPVDSFVGPVADSIVILPRAAFIALNDSLRFQVQGFNGGVPVTQFYVAWSSSDSVVAPITRFGVLRAPAARAAVHVRARTPSGATDSITATFAPPATQMVVIAGAGQTDTVGTPLGTALEVEARAADGLGVGGVPVRFRPLVGGGAVTDTVVVTDGAGRARTTATLGSILGAQSFEASVAGLAGSPATFGATAFAGPATQLVAIAGDLQSAVVATAVATSPAVQAQDQFGNPVPGASIAFAASGSGGNVTGPAQLTNGAGIATVGSWTLGTTAGTDTLTATLSGLTPVTFTATALAGAASRIQALVGGGETAIVNTAVTTAPAVLVTDQFGNPVAGTTVTFTVASGGGSLGAPGAVTTDGAGIATSPAWTIGTAVGANTLTATATALTGSPVTFSATGTAAAASLMAAFAGDGQAALPGTLVSINPAVKVTDQFGNPIAGVPVTFTPSLGGIVTGPTAATDASGVAAVGSWTLGTAPGLNTLDATATGLPTVTFTAQGIVSTASSIALNGGNAQTATVGAILAAYSVKVLDAAGAPVMGVPVSWAVPPNSGTITPAQPTTDAAGIATATRTLGTVAGTQTATASVGGLAGSPVTFSATALADVPTQLVKQSVDLPSATVATSVVAPVVKVADRFGNGVAGAIVSFVVTAGGGIVGAAADTTDILGLATAGSWTLGSLTGTNTITATSGALPSVVFTVTGVAGAPAQLAFLTLPARSLAGDTIAPLVQVAVQDQFGNTAFPAKDVVTLGLGPGGNPLAKPLGTLSVPAFNGVATFADVGVDSAGIGYTLLATAVGLTGAESKPFDVSGVIAAFASDRLQPVDAAFNQTNGLVYVSGVNNTLGVLDPNKGPISQLPILQSQPFGVAVNAQTNRVYVTTSAVLVGSVVVVDGGTNAPIVTIPLTGEGRGIAVDEATNRIYVAVAGDTQKLTLPSLAIIDGIDPRVIATIPFKEGRQAAGVAFNPASKLVYVAIPDLGVGVFDPDPATLAHVTTLPIVGAKGAAGTYGVAVDVRFNLIYGTNRTEGTVSIIDAAVLKEVQRLSVGLLPEGLDVDANRGVVYVGNSGENTVSFIHQDPKTSIFTVFATLIVGPAPKATAVNPLNGQVYVPTFTDNQVRVIEP